MLNDHRVALPSTYRRLSSMRVSLLLWLGSVCLYLLTSAALLDNPDGRSAYGMTQSMVLRGSLVVPPEARLDPMFEPVGREGEAYSKYGLVQPLAQIPLFVLGYGFFPADPIQASQRAVALVHAFSTATTLVVLQHLAYALFRSQRIALGIALIYGFATMAWLYATLTYSEPLLTLILLTTVRVLYAAEEHPLRRVPLFATAGLLSGLAILTKYPAAIYMPALLWYVWKSSTDERRSLVAFVAPLGLGLLALGGYNLWRYGDVLNTGYHIKELTRFPRPPWYGFYTLFFSVGKSIFLYAPPVLIAALALPRFRRDHGRMGTLVVALIVSSVVFYGLVRPWSGAWSPGPRYQLPVLPLALLALGGVFARWEQLSFSRQIGITAAIASGVLVQIPFVATSYNDTLVMLQVITGGAYAWGFWFFDPDYMPLYWQLQILASALSQAVGGPSRLPGPLPFSVDRPGQPIDQVTFWFAHLPAGSPWAMIALMLGLVALLSLGWLIVRVLLVPPYAPGQVTGGSHAALDDG